MSCPICNNNELSQGAESCSQCGSDLEIFNYIESAKKQRAFQSKSGLLLTALLGIVLVGWGSSGLFSDKSGISAVAVIADTTDVVAPLVDSLSLAASAKPVEEFIKEKEEPTAEVAPLPEEAKDLPAATSSVKAPVAKEKVKEKTRVAETVKNGVIIHKVKRGDSFWTISQKYFRNGNHAKQIAADNNLKFKKSIPIGTKLKINK